LNQKKGFTLIEILISTVIAFFVFSLIYMTFFSVGSLTGELQKKMKSSEIFMRFLNNFYEEAKGLIVEKEPDFSFEQKELAFKYLEGDMSYPAYLKYFVESKESGEFLIRQQKNLLTGYVFTVPVLERCESIDFMFYDGEEWNYSMDEKEKPVALALEINYDGDKYFYPVKLPANEKDIKKK